MTHQSNSSARILEAALALFSQKGYEATSTREICELAGITKPTLYYFYESKEGIYRALLREAMGEFVGLIDQGMSMAGGFQAKCRCFAQLAFARLLEKPALGRFLFAICWTPNTPLAAEVHTHYSNALRRIADAADAAVERGEIRPGNTEARMLVLMGALAEAISSFLISGTPQLTPELANAIITAVFEGWEPVLAGTAV
jgi:AcrR family transcriptional regulator